MWPRDALYNLEPKKGLPVGDPRLTSNTSQTNGTKLQPKSQVES